MTIEPVFSIVDRGIQIDILNFQTNMVAKISREDDQILLISFCLAMQGLKVFLSASALCLMKFVIEVYITLSHWNGPDSWNMPIKMTS